MELFEPKARSTPYEIFHPGSGKFIGRGIMGIEFASMSSHLFALRRSCQVDYFQ